MISPSNQELRKNFFDKIDEKKLELVHLKLTIHNYSDWSTSVLNFLTANQLEDFLAPKNERLDNSALRQERLLGQLIMSIISDDFIRTYLQDFSYRCFVDLWGELKRCAQCPQLKPSINELKSIKLKNCTNLKDYSTKFASLLDQVPIDFEKNLHNIMAIFYGTSVHLTCKRLIENNRKLILPKYKLLKSSSNQATIRLSNQETSRSSNQEISRSSNQETSRSSSQEISRSSNQGISRSSNQETSRSSSQEISRSSNQGISRSSNQGISGSLNENFEMNNHSIIQTRLIAKRRNQANPHSPNNLSFNYNNQYSNLHYSNSNYSNPQNQLSNEFSNIHPSSLQLNQDPFAHHFQNRLTLNSQCNYCKKFGHKLNDCFKLKNKHQNKQ